MEPKVADSNAPETCNDGKPWQSSRVERLLKLIDALDEEVESLSAIDDAALQEVTSRLNRVQDTLHSEQELRKRIPDETMSMLKQNQLPACVKLNVGGKVFAASLSTLTSVKGTFFDSMFGGRWPLTPEADGTFSIGRDPMGFSMVLQFLRGDTIDRKRVSECELAAFVEDVDYYGLPVELAEKWLGQKLRFHGEQWSSEDHSDGLSLTEGNMVATHMKPGHDIQLVFGVNAYGGEDHVSVTMRVEHLSDWMLLGVFLECPASRPSVSTPLCYGFSSSGCCYRCGGLCGQFALRFYTGDVIEVELDCKQSKLTVRNTTQNQAASMGLPAGKQWRIHSQMTCKDTSVRIVDSKRL